MDGVSSTNFFPIFYSKREKSTETSTLDKIMTVVGLIFTGFTLAAASAFLLGLNIVIWSTAGVLIGLITGLMLVHSFKMSISPTVDLSPKEDSLPFNSEKMGEPSQIVKDRIAQQFADEQYNHLEEIAESLSNRFKQQPENASLSDANLDQILQVVDQSQIALARQNLYQHLYNKVKEVLGEEKAQEAFRVKGLIDDDLPFPLSQRVINHVIEKTQNYFHNRRVLEDLKEQIHNEEIVSRVFKQLNLNDYLTGHRLLGEKTQQAILECAKKQQIQQEFDLLLGKVKVQAQQDLILDEQFIEKKFNIASILKPLSPDEQKKRREDLQKVINQAYVNREFKQKIRLTKGEKDERKLLAYLKFDIGDQSDYQNKDKVYEILQEIVKVQLQKDLYVGSLSFIKQALNQCALKARLKAAGLQTDLQEKKFQMLKRLFETYKEELIEMHRSIILALPRDFPLDKTSLAVRSLNEHFESDKSVLTYEALARIFKHKNITTRFHDPLISVLDFEQFIVINKKQLKPDEFRNKCLVDLNDPTNSLLAQEIAFYHQWGSYLKAEMIQGFENPSEALGEGVCWAVCQRIRFKGQSNPDLTAQQLVEEIKVIDKDRHQQAAYHIRGLFKTEDKQKIPEYITKGGMKQSTIFRVSYDANEPILNKCFNQNKKLEDSSGWVKLGLAIENNGNTDGHAILVRFDTIKNRYWIIDPNIGFLSFEEKCSPEDAQKKCLQCLKDLFATFYPLSYYLIGDQLVPNNL
jgi:hypothetical protein